MKSHIKRVPGSKVELTVEIAKDEFEKYWSIALEKARLEVEVKGFRPGMAPKELTDAAIDKDKVFDAAVNAAVRRTIEEATEEHSLQVIDQPKIEVKSASAGLTYETVLTVFPK